MEEVEERAAVERRTEPARKVAGVEQAPEHQREAPAAVAGAREGEVDPPADIGAAAREAAAAEEMTAANDYPVRQVFPPVGGRLSLQGSLGTGDFRQVGPGHDISRLPVGVHTPPSVDKSFSTNQSAKRPRQETGPAQRSSNSAAEGGH